MPFDGSNFNPPERQPINGRLAAMHAAALTFCKANNLPEGTACKVTPIGREFVVTVDDQATAENRRIIAARRQAGG